MSLSRLWLDRRAKPPLGLARVNWAHPLSRGLIACYPFNEGAGRAINLARATYDLAPAGAAAFGTAPIGRTANCDGAADTGFVGSTTLPAGLKPSAASVAVIGYFTGVPDNNALIAGWVHNDTDSNPWLSLAIAATGGATAVFYNGGGAFESMVGSTIVTHRPMMLGASYAASSGEGRLYEHGRLVSTGSAGGPIQYGGTAHFSTGILLGTSGRNSRFRALLVLAWNHQLPHALMRAVHLDPWQLFEPVQARRFAVATAAPEPRPIGIRVGQARHVRRIV